jgi:glucoamylase
MCKSSSIIIHSVYLDLCTDIPFFCHTTFAFQTVLASAHSYADMDDYFGFTDERTLANVLKTLTSFENYFNLNQLGWGNEPSLGVAIGRYRGDKYNGGCSYPAYICPGFCGGQPWFLATNGVAEFLFKAALRFKTDGRITVTDVSKDLFRYFGGAQVLDGQNFPLTFESGSEGFAVLVTGLLHGADEQLKRTAFHTDDNYKLDEQFNADTGFMMSAGDLTWSYASLVTASAARSAVDPAGTIASFTNSGNTVLVQVIATNLPPSASDVRIVGNTALLSDWNPTQGVKLHRRRDVKFAPELGSTYHRTEWSAHIRVPANTQIEFKVVSVGSGGVNWQQGANKVMGAMSTNSANPVYSLWE